MEQHSSNGKAPPDEHPAEALERLRTNPSPLDGGNTPPGSSKPAATVETKPAARSAAAAVKGEKQKQPASKKRPHQGTGEKESAKKHHATSGSEQLTFPERLMQLINESIAPGHVGWIATEEAISFKTDGFQEHVLDHFFQGLKYDSFVRKLNRWGFRRVTSEGVQPGFVAYYHNSFRKDEQQLLRSMGIGKKNDPVVCDMQSFGGEQSMIGSASAAAAAGSAAARERENVGTHIYAAALRSPTRQRPNLYPGASSPAASQSSAYAIANLPAAVAMPSFNIQESKSEVASNGAAMPQLDVQQVLLESMLARQRQTDRMAHHQQQRQAAMLAEGLRLQQSQQQQRASSNAAFSTAMAGRNDDLARQLGLITGHPSIFGQQPNQYHPQQHLGRPGQHSSQLSADPAYTRMLQQYLQRSNPNAHANPNPPGAGGHLGTNNPLANLAEAANVSAGNNRAAGNVTDLESLVQVYLAEERRRREGQGHMGGPR